MTGYPKLSLQASNSTPTRVLSHKIATLSLQISLIHKCEATNLGIYQLGWVCEKLKCCSRAKNCSWTWMALIGKPFSSDSLSLLTFEQSTVWFPNSLANISLKCSLLQVICVMWCLVIEHRVLVDIQVDKCHFTSQVIIVSLYLGNVRLFLKSLHQNSCVRVAPLKSNSGERKSFHFGLIQHHSCRTIGVLLFLSRSNSKNVDELKLSQTDILDNQIQKMSLRMVMAMIESLHTQTNKYSRHFR